MGGGVLWPDGRPAKRKNPQPSFDRPVQTALSRPRTRKTTNACASIKQGQPPTKSSDTVAKWVAVRNFTDFAEGSVGPDGVYPLVPPED